MGGLVGALVGGLVGALVGGLVDARVGGLVCGGRLVVGGLVLDEALRNASFSC